jgi:hypothetical protein
MLYFFILTADGAALHVAFSAASAQSPCFFVVSISSCIEPGSPRRVRERYDQGAIIGSARVEGPNRAPYAALRLFGRRLYGSRFARQGPLFKVRTDREVRRTAPPSLAERAAKAYRRRREPLECAPGASGRPADPGCTGIRRLVIEQSVSVQNAVPVSH